MTVNPTPHPYLLLLSVSLWETNISDILLRPAPICSHMPALPYALPYETPDRTIYRDTHPFTLLAKCLLEVSIGTQQMVYPLMLLHSIHIANSYILAHS